MKNSARKCHYLPSPGFPERPLSLLEMSSSPIKKRRREEDEELKNKKRNGISSSKKKDEDKDDESDSAERREEVHREAHSELLKAQKELPFISGAIKVLDFGSLRPSSSAFHTPVSLYPVGYKSEIIVEHRESPFRPLCEETVLCEVLEVDDQPEFILTVQSSGRVFIASSEDGVWKKFEEKYTVTTFLSFFNLGVDLLLEGLDGATECEEYLFHFERGYGTEYFTDEQAVIASALFMPRQSRESRSRHRSARSMSAADNKAIEDERKKAKIRKEKEMKEQERAAKEKQREIDRARKEEERALKQEQREAKKEADRLKREQERLLRKEQNRQQSSVRKGNMTELRKSRADAAELVLQCFDEEEEQEQRDQATIDVFSARLDDTSTSKSDIDNSSSLTEKSSSLDSFLNQLPSFQDELCVSTSADIEQILDSFNCLYSLRGYLGISPDLTFNKFIKDILGNPLGCDQLSEEVNSQGWDEDARRSSRLAASQPSFITPHAQDTAEMDRIQLNMLRTLLPDLHARFSLDDEVEAPTKKESSSSRKGAKDKETAGTGRTAFPLNQLTWTELSRMLLLEFIDIEMEKSEEEIVHSLRGSKTVYSKSPKNIIKNIRCRLATRHLASICQREDEFAAPEKSLAPLDEDKEDGLLQFQLSLSPLCVSQQVTSTLAQESESLFDFTSEAEVVSAVSEASSSPHSDVVRDSENIGNSSDHELKLIEEYQRCCKVWLKIMSMTQAKCLLWEVDENMYPGYFSDMQRPISLINVAYKLLQRSYPSSLPKKDEGESAVSGVSSCFYRDMRQVFVNCIAYNSEATIAYGYAQKLLQVLHRHMQQWVFSPTRPGNIAHCDDGYCLQTHEPIANRDRGQYSSVKCGRCAGVFSLDALQQLDHHQEYIGIFQPSQDEVLQSNEDWICFMCLREDGVAVPRTINDFSIDEWGASTRLPWHLNTRHILQLYNFTDDLPSLPDVVEAVKILVSPNLTPLLPIPGNHDQDKTSRPLLPWTMRERLKVYFALCELLKTHDASHAYMTDLYKECTKLTKMSVKDSFCEADFIEQVKKVAGLEGVAMCRSLLDGVEVDSEDALRHKQHKVVEGRCIHCRGSTFDDDIAENDFVLLCDGCNAEAHLSCLAIDKVPANEWYCDPCSERIASRVEGDETSLDIDSWRRLDLEAELQEELTYLEREGLPNPRSSEVCAYCGGTELDICSPLVYGQSRDEFNEYIKEFIGTLDLDPSDTEQPISKTPSIPFFPLYSDPRSSKMLSSHGINNNGGKMKKGECKNSNAVVTCPVVHELCALKMCKARMQRSRHSIRRKRKLIAERVADMSYISSRPLGHDEKGRFYWRFPNSNNSLFISPPSSMSEREPDKEALAEKLEAQRLGRKEKKSRTPQKKNRPDSDHAKDFNAVTLFDGGNIKKDPDRGSGDKWIRITHVLEIAKIIELLGTSRSNAEVSLSQVLGSLYHGDIAKYNQELQKEEVEKGNGDGGDNESEKMDVAEEKDGSQSGIDNVKDVTVASLEKTDSPSQESEEKTQFAEFAYKEDEEKGEKELSTNDSIDDDEGWDYGRRRPPRRAAAPVIPRAKPGEGVPVVMRLLPELGPEVQPQYRIKKEKVFEDSAFNNDDGDYSDDDDDDLSYQKYFVFSRSSKFFAVALQDCYDTTCRLGKRFTVNFQIHYEDEDEPLAITHLNEPWDDGVYYFATLNFKKSGKYTISFLAGGTKASNIAPLVFPVEVVADHVSLGAECALDSLRAYEFLSHGERHITHRRRELATELNRTHNEFVAVKSCLLAVYLALPLGSLNMGYIEEDKTSKYDMATGVVNATGWNTVVDQLWRDSVLSATTSAALMECTLLLEFYVQKNWLQLPHSKLLSTLPSPHYAMRCPTCSSVALRVFCLDKALAYDRVQDIPRPSRAIEAERKDGMGRSSGRGRKEIEKPRKSRNSQAAKRGLDRLESSVLVDDTTMYGSIGSSRPRRAAMTKARENLTISLRRQEYDGWDDDEEFGGSKRRRRTKDSEESERRGLQEWSCPACTYVNPPRARSCEACSQRKPAEGEPARQVLSREERMRRRRGAAEDEDDEEEDEEDEFEDESSSEGDGEEDGDDDDVESRSSGSRKRRRNKSETGSAKRGASASVSKSSNGDSAESDEEFDDEMNEALQVDIRGMMTSRREQLVERGENPYTEKSGGGCDLVLQMLGILCKLQDDPTSVPFWVPVDEDYYTDYRDKVGFYAHPDEFAEDVRKVWLNCQAYNMEGSEIFSNSKHLSSIFEGLLKEMNVRRSSTTSEEQHTSAECPEVEKKSDDNCKDDGFSNITSPPECLINSEGNGDNSDVNRRRATGESTESVGESKPAVPEKNLSQESTKQDNDMTQSPVLQESDDTQ